MSYLKLILLITLLFVSAANAQILRVDEGVSKSTVSSKRERGLKMLTKIKEILELYYYDKSYRGIDIDKKFSEARDQVKNLETNADIFRVIAGVLLEFNDSHTRFYPPDRTNKVEYGFTLQIIGDRCLVTDVTKGSDAEKQGMSPGDIVTKIGQYPVTRDSLWVINYFIYQLEPIPDLPIVVRKPNRPDRSLVIQASFKTLDERRQEAEKRRNEKAENPYKCAKLSPDTIACKLRSFVVDKKMIDRMMTEVAGSKKLILDLRGNGGGYVRTEEYLTGHFFDRDVKIADMITRKKTETMVAKPVAKRAFTGELVVLIDSRSASASELFSRVIQIEKRGKVVGDVSAGAVMTSYNMGLAVPGGSLQHMTFSPYGLNVSVADVIMSDGKRLEQMGVVPDHPVGPSSAAVAAKNDPVLAFAAELMGVKLTPQEAGKLDFLYKKVEAEVDDDEDSKAGGEKQ
ncbi:MAG TPA: S41 family peptidase [Pyrinomonadaceae bacterium]|nr:S41 family peptidase [Pyrinomonadaceae bacterium]